MKRKLILMETILIVMTLTFAGCTKKDNKSDAETVMETERESTDYIYSETESTTESLQEEEPTYDLDISTDDIEFFEQFPGKVYHCQYEDVEAFIKGVFGETEIKEVGEIMNDHERMVQKTQFDYLDGISILGEKFYAISVDYDMEDKTVYTVGFHKNTDINTTEGYTPTPDECRDCYERLNKILRDIFGERDTVYTPEQYRYYGLLWNDTDCGEVWLAWGEEIFGSKQPDCILSFSE